MYRKWVNNVWETLLVRDDKFLRISEGRHQWEQEMSENHTEGLDGALGFEGGWWNSGEEKRSKAGRGGREDRRTEVAHVCRRSMGLMMLDDVPGRNVGAIDFAALCH